MKRKWLLLTLALVAVLAFAACGKKEDPAPSGGTTTDGGAATTTDSGAAAPSTSAGTGSTVINVMSFTDEVPNMITRYMELNPDFASRYTINTTVIATDGGGYQTALDNALIAGGNSAPYIYCAEAAFVARYTQGDMAGYAGTYASLGINDLSGKISSAQIAPYSVDLGSRNGELVGLAFQATGSAVIYRRSLAQAVWGTDDPAAVQAKIGPGWDRFMEAAAEMNAAGYAMVSGAGDVWQAVRNTGGPWIVNGALNIHPDRMAMYDYAHTLYNNGYMNDAGAWSDAWFADMQGAGERETFAFLGPAWLINYVMAGNSGDTYGDWAICVPPVGFTWGGTWIIPGQNIPDDARDGVREIIEWITLDTSESGLQYHWANGTLFGEGGTKDTVASGAVMSRSNGELDFLGGQNMFDVMVPAGAFADGSLFTQYDESINAWFIDTAMNYARGDLSRDDALASFRMMVAENLGIN